MPWAVSSWLAVHLFTDGVTCNMSISKIQLLELYATVQQVQRQVDCLLLALDDTTSQYCSPVGSEADRASGKIWPGQWLSALGHNRWYKYGLHEADDLNLNSPEWDADAHSPVYAIADGEVYAVRVGVTGWHTVICVKHALCLTRYAHVENILVRQGQNVTLGQQLACIGNAGGRFPYHLHFSIARPDARMLHYPLDWPGFADDAVERVTTQYYNPTEFLRTRV